jgi:hypothetical protein
MNNLCHYWMNGVPEIINDKNACLDWSVANSGKLAAYRWDGEKNLTNEHLVWVDSI